MKLLLCSILFLIFCSISFYSMGQTCGTVNVALSKPITVPGQMQWHPGSDAVDGNPSTWWYADSTTLDTVYLYVDLGQSYSICKVNIVWGNNGKAANYKVQTSTTALANDWTDIATVTGNSTNTNTLTVSGNGRYVRVFMTLRYYWWDWYQIMELEVYNSLAGNQKPVVNLTAPANNSTISEGSNLVLTATASDPDGSISKVDFYNGNVKLATVTSAPYTYTFSNIYDGVYTFKARAFDNANDSTTSDTSHVTVVPDAPGWSLTGNAGTSPTANFMGTTDNQRVVFKANNVEVMTIHPSGFVGIGTTAIPGNDAEGKLAVKGTIYAKKLKITQLSWSDDVFGKGYRLRKLSEVADYINKHQHLPDMPSEKEVIGQPLDVSQIQSLLLKKIEELTLYIIDQQKKMDEHERRSDAQIGELRLQVEELKKKVQPVASH